MGPRMEFEPEDQKGSNVLSVESRVRLSEPILGKDACPAQPPELLKVRDQKMESPVLTRHGVRDRWP